jgi:hypothetical protein
MQNNQNLTQEQLQNLPKGWADVQLTADMPLSALVQFLNVLNQRLASVEDKVVAIEQDGETLTFTQLYQKQAEREQELLQQQLNEQEEEEERSQFA